MDKQQEASLVFIEQAIANIDIGLGARLALIDQLTSALVSARAVRASMEGALEELYEQRLKLLRA